MAQEYYGGNATSKRMNELDTLLAVHGISPEQIRAKAMQLCGGSIQLFNKMEMHCENFLRLLRKENDRRPEPEPGSNKDEG